MMWMTTPINIISMEKGRLVAADNGTTMRFMKKYTAMPYSAPERTAYRTRNGAKRLAATKTAAAKNAITKWQRRPNNAVAIPRRRCAARAARRQCLAVGEAA